MVERLLEAIYDILSVSTKDFIEDIWIHVKILGNIYVFGSLYRPPHSNFPNFLSHLEDRLGIYFQYELICGGDLNINLLNPSTHYAVDFLDSLESYNLQQVINTPTRLCDTNFTLLDVIIIPEDIEHFQCGTIKTSHISDHSLTFCNLLQVQLTKTMSGIIKI